jgi:hypothetical protein
VIVILAVAAGGFAASCVLGWGLVVAGLRAGDHPGDASVAAVLVPGPRPVIVATVRNPGDVPLLAGHTVGVVPAGGQVQFRVAASGGGLAARRRYRLTAAVGQAGGRLRVIGVPVVSGGPAGAGRPAPAARAWDRD